MVIQDLLKLNKFGIPEPKRIKKVIPDINISSSSSI